MKYGTKCHETGIIMQNNLPCISSTNIFLEKKWFSDFQKKMYTKKKTTIFQCLFQNFRFFSQILFSFLFLFKLSNFVHIFDCFICFIWQWKTYFYQTLFINHYNQKMLYAYTNNLNHLKSQISRNIEKSWKNQSS